MNKHILCTLPFDDKHKKLLSEKHPSTKFTYTNSEKLTSDMILSANALIGNVSNDNINYLNHLEFIQLASAGYDQYLADDILSKDTVLCNAGDAYGVSVSEHLLAMVLSLAKKIPEYRDYQNKSTWTDLGEVMPLHDLNVLVIGLGAIGTSFAKLMHLLGNNVIGIKNNVNNKPDFIREVYKLDEVDKLLPNADIVVMAIPVTNETKGYMTKNKFSLMKKTALFFNIGRGALVDHNALINALENDIIAGAGIDVTHIEPLPEDDKLWQTKNLLITPHISGGFHIPETLIKIQKTAIDNIDIYINGGCFNNKVN